MAKSSRKSDKDGLYKRERSPYWYASFTDGGGKRTRCSTGTADRREAEALLAKWRLQSHQERYWDEEPQRTFDDVLVMYLDDAEHRIRSAERQRGAAKNLYPHFTGRDVANITAVDIRSYVESRRANGVGPATINRELGTMSAAINFCRRELDWNIPNPVSCRKLPAPQGRVRWIEQSEANALVDAAKSEVKAPHLPDFIQLGLHTGMRRGELLGLEWDRVDFHNGLIYLESIHTKTEKRRSVPINATARSALLTRASYRASHCPAAEWVFCRSDGSRIKSVKRSFATACRRAGIEDFHVHDLRHTCAAWLVTAGVALPEVRDLLGHSSTVMTERYAHLAPDNVRAAVARLEQVTSHFGHTDSSNQQTVEDQ